MITKVWASHVASCPTQHTGVVAPCSVQHPQIWILYRPSETGFGYLMTILCIRMHSRENWCGKTEGECSLMNTGLLNSLREHPASCNKAKQNPKQDCSAMGTLILNSRAPRASISK